MAVNALTRKRPAEDLPVWCEQAAIVAAAFARALGQAGPDAPGDIVLNRLDWGLEHLRRLSTAARWRGTTLSWPSGSRRACGTSTTCATRR